MKKHLIIENDTNLRLLIDINLNKMKLSIEKKLPSLEIYEVHTSEEYTIDLDSKIEEIIEKFYLEYLRVKDIELFWKEEFKEGELIKFNIEEGD